MKDEAGAGKTALRREIDALDREIVAALKARMRLSAKMGALKSAEGLPVRDEARERELLGGIEAMCSDADSDGDVDAPASAILEIYREILKQSRALQENGLQKD